MRAGGALGVLAMLSIGCQSTGTSVDRPGDAGPPHDASTCDGAVTTVTLMLIAPFSLEGVSAVLVTVTDSAGDMQTSVQPFVPPVAITPTSPQMVTVALPDLSPGTLVASAEVRDAQACALARGTTAFTIGPCAHANVAVMLSPVAGCGGLDAGSDAGAADTR